MIDGSDKRHRQFSCQLAFELQNSNVCEKCSKIRQSFWYIECVCVDKPGERIHPRNNHMSQSSLPFQQ